MSEMGSSGGADSGASAASGSTGAEVGANGVSGASSPESADSGGQGDGDVGASLLTREDGNDDGGTSGQGDADGKDPDPANLVPAKAEDYALTFADGVAVDEAMLSGFKSAAHELGISQGQAQKLADFYAGAVAGSAKAAQETQVAALVEAKNGWEAEITARPGFKSEVADARRTLKEFGSDALNELMDQSLLGSHPVFFDFVVKVGKALAEPEARGRGMGGGRERPLADRLWPDMK